MHVYTVNLSNLRTKILCRISKVAGLLGGYYSTIQMVGLHREFLRFLETGQIIYVVSSVISIELVYIRQLCSNHF